MELTAKPDANHSFQGWQGLPAGASNNVITAFALSGNKNVIATFGSLNQEAGPGA